MKNTKSEEIKKLKQEEQKIPNYKPACQRIFEGHYASVLDDKFNRPENLSNLDKLILGQSPHLFGDMGCGKKCPGYEKMPIHSFNSPFGDKICCQRMVKDYIGKGTKKEWKEFRKKVRNYIKTGNINGNKR